MKSAIAACSDTLTIARSRTADYLELIRPRIASMVLFTVAAGFCLADARTPDLARLLHTAFGTGLVVAGATALNQVLERSSDALMERTRLRPLPSRRLQRGEVLLFGVILALSGLLYLLFTVRQPLVVLEAGFAFGSYLFVYTPLKRKTTLNTLVGAIPGALPPVIGWTAATNTIEPATAVLFAILFFWQVPHFLAIAWIHREDYARSELCMLPVLDPSGDRTARHMVAYCLALFLVSVIPPALGWAGVVYLLGAVILESYSVGSLRRARIFRPTHAAVAIAAGIP